MSLFIAKNTLRSLISELIGEGQAGNVRANADRFLRPTDTGTGTGTGTGTANCLAARLASNQRSETKDEAITISERVRGMRTWNSNSGSLQKSFLNRRSQRSQRVTVFKSRRRHVRLRCLNRDQQRTKRSLVPTRPLALKS